MSFSDDSMVMPVAPAYGNNGGFGGWGSDIWLILIVLLAFGGFGGYGGGFGGNMGYDFPWLLNGQQGINANTNAGFNQAATQSAISGLQSSVISGFGDVQLGIAGVNQNICQTGNGIVNALNTGFANAETGATARQMANMQQVNGLSAQLAQCCCDNRLATANLSALVQSENCADRAAVSDGIRDIIENQTANTQRILDQMCNDKIDAKNEKIADLERQLTMANLASSQVAQTAQIVADNTAQTQYLINRIAPYPVPSYNVPNPNMYGYNVGCGCGA